MEPVKGVESEETLAVPTPPISADPATLLRHLQAHEPLKLALTRDFPLVVQKLQKTSRGIKRMESEDPEDGQLHKGLGWLHYRASIRLRRWKHANRISETLLTYATTLAFYIHINSLPPSSRPDIPIIPRLLELKQGLTSLEDLDFDAASVSANPLTLYNPLLDWAEGEDEELKEGKAELIKRMQAVNGEDWEDDVDDLWQKEGLEENELEDLLKDADKGEGDVEMLVAKSQKKKKEKKSKKEKKVKKSENDDLEGFDGLDGFDDLDDLEGLLEDEKPKNKSKKSKKIKGSESSSSTAAFAPLAEPEFFTSKSKSKKPLSDESDPLGDPTALTDADASDKSARKRSLAFHTSKINATLARRAEGRANRMGGDEDVPYRDRRKARDDALKRNSVRSEGEDLEEVRAEKEKKKRARDEIEDDGKGVADDDEADGYYELVKRRRKEEKEAKEAEHEAIEEQLLYVLSAQGDVSSLLTFIQVLNEQLTMTKLPMVLEPLPALSRRTVVSPHGDQRPVETLESRRGKHTTKRRRRLPVNVVSTRVVRRRTVGSTRVKRLVSPKSSRVGSSRWENSVWVFCVLLVYALVQYYTNEYSKVSCLFFAIRRWRSSLFEHASTTSRRFRYRGSRNVWLDIRFFFHYFTGESSSFN